MATTITAEKELGQQRTADAVEASERERTQKARLGLKARQIALITLLVAVVVAVATVINIAHLTGVIVNRAEKEAQQFANQIGYAIKQELAHRTIEHPNPHTALSNEHSGVRGLMEATIATPGAISYLMLTDKTGQIVKDEQGKNALIFNQHVLDDYGLAPPSLQNLTNANAYLQLVRILFGEPIYEYQQSLDEGEIFKGQLHIGISAGSLRRELVPPILINLIIGLVAIMGAALVAISSANLLLRPLEAISSSIDRLSGGSEPATIASADLPRDEMITGVTSRLRQLGERLAGERSELEIMRGRLRQVISHLEERLLLINREGRVILASPDAEQVLGVEGIEMTGLPVDESLGYDHPLVQTVERAFSERKSIARATLRVPKNGGTRQLLTSVQYIEDAGEPVGALVSLRDYESFQKYESQWDLSKKLADLGRITSGIAHEVKNPLNAMVIHLEILRSKIESGSGNPAPQIEILDSEIKRLDRVVQTFLNFTRPVEVRLEPLELNRIVNQVIAVASTEAHGRGVTIHRQLAGEPLMIKGDADLLMQALLNVIINGCQAMPEGGPLKVSTVNEKDGTVRVIVVDRGIGISQEGHDRIFNLYYTTKKGGTGIGLAQAFRAIQLHNGSIRFESEVGVGTTFEIILPALS
ncbi:MAG TPA: ATP-binding protein [Blastocatellia bacterium]|jgi:PAS domain S-box-containing protein